MLVFTYVGIMATMHGDNVDLGLDVNELRIVRELNICRDPFSEVLIFRFS